MTTEATDCGAGIGDNVLFFAGAAQEALHVLHDRARLAHDDAAVFDRRELAERRLLHEEILRRGQEVDSLQLVRKSQLFQQPKDTDGARARSERPVETREIDPPRAVVFEIVGPRVDEIQPRQVIEQRIAWPRNQDLVVGIGATAAVGDTVTVNYVGTLTNGTKFDSSGPAACAITCSRLSNSSR